MQEITKSKHGYVAVTGTLTFDESKLPRPDPETMDGPELTKIKAHIVGKALSRAGFKNDFSADLTLNVACFGFWCANAAEHSKVLVFLKQSPQGYSLSVTPCGDHLFPDPTRADLNTVKRCYLSGNCPKPTTY